MKLNHMRYLTSAQLYNLKRILAWTAEKPLPPFTERLVTFDHSAGRWTASERTEFSQAFPSTNLSRIVADAPEFLDLGKLVPKVRK